MTTQARELAKLVTNAGDVNLGDDISLASDGAILNFGADSDVILTHVADTGLLLNSSRQLQFGDSGTFIRQEADGVLDLTSDTEIELNATTLDINANVDISGTLTVAGNLDFGDAVLSNVGAVQLDSIAGDGDTNTSITFSGSDVITIATGGSGRLTIGDGALSPVTDNQIDLGTSSLEFKDAFFDGTVETDNLTIGGAQGSDGQVLTSTGSGVGWENASGGAVSAINNATANELVTIGSTTTELDAEANLTFDGTTLSSTSGTAGAWIASLNNSATGGAGVLITSAGAAGSENLLDVRNGDGTKFVVKQSDGKVGIGTASPAQTLSVDASGGANLFVSRTSQTGGLYIESDGTNGVVRNPANNPLLFQTNGANTRMTILGDGKVAIGTTTPNRTLSVSTGLAKTSTTTAYPFAIQSNESSGNAQLSVHATGGASAAVRKWIWQTEEAGVANNGIISFQPFGGKTQIGSSSGAYTFAEKLIVGDADANDGITIQSGTTHQGNVAFAKGGGTTADGRISYQHDSNYMEFLTNNTVRLRINSSGRQTFNGSGTANAHATFVGEVGVSSKALAFEHTVGGGEVGTIVTGSSSTTYNTSSDYRLKENVDYTWDATTRLKQLKPARFNWIADDTNTLLEGFLAHEVSSIVPEAVSGEKDAMADPILYQVGDELPSGKSVGDVKKASSPAYQGIDHSKLVPLLVKTIQELEARITTLEG